MLIASLITGVIFGYSLIKLIIKRKNDPLTPTMIKLMWGFIAGALIIRILFFMTEVIIVTFDQEFSGQPVLMPI